MVTWLDLLQLSDSHFAKLDVGLVNLLCAVGLPKAERLNVDSYLKILDSWAQSVQQYTENLLPRFRRSPEKYANSEAYFRCLCLITVLQRDLGVRSTDKLNVPDPMSRTLVIGFSTGSCKDYPALAPRSPFSTRLLDIG